MPSGNEIWNHERESVNLAGVVCEQCKHCGCPWPLLSKMNCGYYAKAQKPIPSCFMGYVTKQTLASSSCSGPAHIPNAGQGYSSCSGPAGGGVTMCGFPVEILPIPDLIDKADVNKCNETYPHKCPHCGAAAYVGLNAVDCRAKCQRSDTIT